MPLSVQNESGFYIKKVFFSFKLEIRFIHFNEEYLLPYWTIVEHKLNI